MNPTAGADYKQGDNKFTGRILKVTIDLKPTTPATADAAEKARRQTALKRALSN